MDVVARLRNAADFTERFYPHGTLYENYVEMLRLCAEFQIKLNGLTPDAEVVALRERLSKLARTAG